MFKRDGFSPVFITGTKVPRIFAYTSDEDGLKEIMAPGYFNSQRIMILKNSFIDVVCKDCAVRLVVGTPEGLNVVIRPDYFLAKFAEEMEEIKPDTPLTPEELASLTPQQRGALTRKANALEKVAKTG